MKQRERNGVRYTRLPTSAGSFASDRALDQSTYVSPISKRPIQTPAIADRASGIAKLPVTAAYAARKSTPQAKPARSRTLSGASEPPLPRPSIQ